MVMEEDLTIALKKEEEEEMGDTGIDLTKRMMTWCKDQAFFHIKKTPTRVVRVEMLAYNHMIGKHCPGGRLGQVLAGVLG